MKTRRSLSLFRACQACREGFTLTELLVIVAVLAILITLRASAIASAKDQSRVAQCADNLKQFAMALQMFGAENNDKQPVSTGGNWAWDLSWSAGNSITPYIPFQKLYCPGTAVRFTAQDNSNLWNTFAANLFHIPGYLTTFPGTAIIASNQNATLTPQRTSLPAPSASQRVLVADATISGSSTDNHAGFVAGANYNFTTIYGGYSVPHLSPHLNGLIPAGGNVAMLDGHVQWRKFLDMDQRATMATGFWW
jgi:prepilin-type processing-associated H-X9-DG protein